MNEFLAIDIGASSGRHILGSVRDGILTIEEIYRFRNSPVMQDGGLVWDIGYLRQEIINGLKKAGEMGRPPKCVGIDTWAVDYALLDRDKSLVGPVHAYRSERTQSVISAVHGKVPFDVLYQRTGIQFQTFNTVYQLAADRKSGALDRAQTMLMLPDYRHFILTGKMAREYTNATSTGLVNAAKHTWDEGILRSLGYPSKLFTPLTQPGAVLGSFSKEIREQVGYNALVVLPATHDTASAVVASLAGKGAYLSSGTWSLLGTVQNTAHTEEKCRAYNFSNEGHLFGRYRFQKNIMGLWIVQRLREEEAPQLSFVQLAALAEQSKCDCEIDVNGTAYLAPKNMKMQIEAEVGRKLSLGEALYAAFKGLAVCYRNALTEISSVTGEQYRELNIFGGGSKNSFLNRLTAEAAKVKVIAGPTEATAIGNLLVQMDAMGELSLKDAPAIVARSFETEEFTA